jgi:sulfate adenylyltransferase
VQGSRLPPAPGGDASRGVLWPMPITLNVPDSVASKLGAGSKLALRDSHGVWVAVMTVTDVWRPDRLAEARHVFNTVDAAHPGVAHLLHDSFHWYAGGPVAGLALPALRFGPAALATAADVRQAIAARRWRRTVAFQTRNPLHRAHIELTRLAAQEARAGLLLHPIVGMTKPGDIDAAVRIQCYHAVLASGRYYAANAVILALLPVAMRMGGPREALWHAIMRKNHGATHFIVGRDHAGCKAANGSDFYGPYEAQALLRQHEAELGITILAYQEVAYVPAVKAFLPADRVPPGAKPVAVSGTKFRGMLQRRDPVPTWYSDPAVIALLRAAQERPPTSPRGFVVLFTGYSGSGKTTICTALERGGCRRLCRRGT